jgi:pyruvate kinase
MRRNRNAKIVATLGPASSTEDIIRRLFVAGVDMFRMNFSHGTQAEHKERVETVRRIGREFNRPIGILGDSAGPQAARGQVRRRRNRAGAGREFRLDLNPAEGDAARASLPHPEIFAALVKGANLLLDDGKLALQVEECGKDYALTRVVVGGRLTDRKGVNVPDVVLPITPLTEKDSGRSAIRPGTGDRLDRPVVRAAPEDIAEARAHHRRPRA